MDRVNHLWPDIAALTPRVGLAWCYACQYTAPRTAVLTGTSWASRRCKGLGLVHDPACAGVAAFLNRTFALQFPDRAHALRWAAQNGHVAVLQFLKNWDLSLQDVRSWDNYALRWAAQNGHVAVLQFLKDSWGSTASGSQASLTWPQATKKADTSCLTLEDVRSDHNYALRWAAQNGQVAVLQFLKDNWDLTLRDVRCWDNHALRRAAEAGHVAVLQFLKDNWDLTLQDVRCDCNYALRHAALYGHVGVLQFLKNNWDLTLQDVRTKNNCAMRWAAYKGRMAVLQWLRDNWNLTFEDVRSKDNYALRWATMNGHTRVVRFLEEWLASFHEND